MNPLATHRMLPAQPLAGPITDPSAVRSLTAAFAAPALPPVCRYILDFLLRFHLRCLAELLDIRRCQTQSVNRLSLAPASTVPGPRVLSSTSITRLHRYYDPIRHPRGPVPCLTTPPLASTTCQPPQGASRVAHNPSFAHAVATTPAEPLGACVVRFPNGGGLPRNAGGSASASIFSRPAQRSLHVTACTLAESLTDPLHQKLRPIRYLHGRSDCYRLERLLPGGVRTH